MGSDRFGIPIANVSDAETKLLADELKAFRRYDPAIIPCLYNHNKCNKFKQMAEEEGMEYSETIYGDYCIYFREDNLDIKP